MTTELYHSDILDIQADVLVCSANVSLNLSGGVGGALLYRYGAKVQDELYSHLPIEPPRFAKQGDVIMTHPTNTPYLAVLHAVAVDPFYNSSPIIITRICRLAFRMAAEQKAKSLALTVLATGYGNMTIAQFAEGLRPVLKENFTPLDTIKIAVQDYSLLKELAEALPEGKKC